MNCEALLKSVPKCISNIWLTTVPFTIPFCRRRLNSVQPFCFLVSTNPQLTSLFTLNRRPIPINRFISYTENSLCLGCKASLTYFCNKRNRSVLVSKLNKEINGSTVDPWSLYFIFDSRSFCNKTFLSFCARAGLGGFLIWKVHSTRLYVSWTKSGVADSWVIRSFGGTPVIAREYVTTLRRYARKNKWVSN